MASLRRSTERDRIVAALIVGLFLANVAVPRVIGAGDATTVKLFAQAALFSITLSGIFLMVMRRRILRIDPQVSGLVLTVIVFIALSVVSLNVGILRGHPTIHVLGDFYKFTIVGATVLGLYFACNDRRTFRWAITIAHSIFVFVLIVVIGLYAVGVFEPNERLSLLYMFPAVLAIAYWLFAEGHPAGRVSFPFLVLAMPAVIYYSQSLLLAIQSVMVVSLTILYYRYRRIGIFLLPAGFLGIGVFLLLTSINVPSAITISLRHSGYLGVKFASLLSDYSFYETLVLLGGSRAAEPFGVLTAIDDSLLQVLFGAGMGSTFAVDSPFETSIWVGRDHFVHAGFWEAVLRTGLLGGIAYAAIGGYFLLYSWRVRQVDALGATACALATINLLFLPFSGKLLGTQFFDYAALAYVMVLVSGAREQSITERV